MSQQNPEQRPAAPITRRKWVPWAIGAAAILLLLLLLTRCGGDDDIAEVTTAPPVATVPGTPVAPVAVAPAGISGLEVYLASAEAAPRTFAFERVHFDTGSDDIRAEDRAEIAAVAAALNAHPTARVKLYGYADSRGAAPANVALAQARAIVIRSALTAAGVDARRIEAASGGEGNPVDSNATAAGMAENRRTELVVLQR